MRTGLLVLWVAGCGFQPNPNVPVIGDGQSPTIDAADAAVIHMIDAKEFHDAMAVNGSLAVTVATLGSSNLDITAEGTIDWVHWGYLGATGFDRKNGGNAISNVTPAPPLSFTGAPFTASWSNGAPPHMSVSSTSSGAGMHAGTTLTFTVTADATPRTLSLYAGVQEASGRLDVALSDGSAPAQMKMLTDNSGTTNVRYTIAFNAASAGQTLTVSWTDTNDFGGGSAFAALLEATLH